MHHILLRIFGILVVLGFAITFLGLTLRGVVDLTNAIRIGDVIYGTAFLLIGIVFFTIAVQTVRRICAADWVHQFLSRARTRKPQYMVTAALVVLTMVFAVEIGSILALLGQAIGFFFISTARVTYQNLIGIDLYTIRFDFFAWVFQWYFIDYIVRAVFRFAHKRSLKHQHRAGS